MKYAYLETNHRSRVVRCNLMSGKISAKWRGGASTRVSINPNHKERRKKERNNERKEKGKEKRGGRDRSVLAGQVSGTMVKGHAGRRQGQVETVGGGRGGVSTVEGGGVEVS